MDAAALCKKSGVGLTGGIATGKSTVAKMIAEAGYPVIDADQLAREAVVVGSPGYRAVLAAFGPSILLPDGSLNRRALAQLVFAEPQHRQRLEAILHPQIWSLLKDRLEGSSSFQAGQPWFYEASLLFETGTYQRFRSLWVTWCPQPLQLTRLMARNQLQEAEALAIIQQQMPGEEKKRRAQVVIDTSSSLEEVARQTQQALQELRHQLALEQQNP